MSSSYSSLGSPSFFRLVLVVLLAGTLHHVRADRVHDILARMTLEQKVGQLVQISLEKAFVEGGSEIDPQMLKAVQNSVHPGAWGGNPFSNHWPKWGQTYWNVTEFRRRADDLHRALKELNNEIPALLAWDAGHGASYLYNGTVYPHQIGAAASFNRDLLYQMGRSTSRESLAAGFNWIMMPVVNLGVQPRWGRFYETFGEDPYVAGELGAAMIKGIQGERLSVSAAKHFLAYEAPAAGIERGTVELHPRSVLQYFVPPFQAAVDAGAWTIMESFNEISGVPVVSSTEYLRDVIRHRMGFEGVLHCDWEEVSNMITNHKIAASQEEAIRISLEQTDIDMPHMADVEWMLGFIKEAVRNGTLPVERLDRSVERILRMKEWLGMFEEDYNPTPIPSSEVGSSEHRQAAYQLALESMTLLKNQGGLLPLDAKRLSRQHQVLITGPTAASLTYLDGGWTVHWGGAAHESELAYGTTIVDGIRAKAAGARYIHSIAVDGSPLQGTDRQELVDAAAQASVVVVCLGEANYAEKKGEMLGDPHLPAGQIELVRDLALTGTPIILVVVEGRPRLLGDAADLAQAIVMAYLPGPEGGRAIAETLFGDHNPAGRLPFTYPSFDGLYTMGVPYYRKPTQVVMNFSSPNPSVEPRDWLPPPHLYPFGHGLSYSTFTYSNLKVTPDIVTSLDTAVTVSVDVTNTGPSLPGQHTVLLFLTDVVRRVTPEAKLLKGFQKVWLEVGQSTTVTFQIDVQRDLSYIGIDLRSVLENGDFFVGVGHEADCRQHWDDAVCKRFNLQLSDEEYDPVCEAACKAWTVTMPKYCKGRPNSEPHQTADRGAGSLEMVKGTRVVPTYDSCHSTCRADGDWGWNYVECLEQEALGRSCNPERRCRPVSSWALE